MTKLLKKDGDKLRRMEAANKKRIEKWAHHKPKFLSEADSVADLAGDDRPDGKK